MNNNSSHSGSSPGSVARLVAAVSALLLLTSACGSSDTNQAAQQPQVSPPEIASQPSDDEDAASFPERNIRFIIAYAPGGTTDPMGREFALRLGNSLQRRVLVENVGGAAATIGTGAIASSDPDGYTIGLTENGALAYQPQVMTGLPYGLGEGYSILGKIGGVVYTLATLSNSFGTYEELVAEAKSRPGEITVSTPGPGNPGDLAVRQLDSALGNIFNIVPYNGGGAALAALLSGEVDVNLGATATIKAQSDAGVVNPLVTLSDERFFGLPSTPAIAEFGIEAYTGADFYLIAPPGVPTGVLRKLREETAEILFSQEFQEWLRARNVVPKPMRAEEADQDLQGYAEIFSKLIG